MPLNQPRIQHIQTLYTDRKMDELIRLLRDHPGTVNYIFFCGYPILSQAILDSRLDFLSQLLSLPEINLNIGEFSRRPAIVAIRQDNVDALTLLLQSTHPIIPFINETHDIFKIAYRNHYAPIIETLLKPETRLRMVGNMLRADPISAEMISYCVKMVLDVYLIHPSLANQFIKNLWVSLSTLYFVITLFKTLRDSNHEEIFNKFDVPGALINAALGEVDKPLSCALCEVFLEKHRKIDPQYLAIITLLNENPIILARFLAKHTDINVADLMGVIQSTEGQALILCYEYLTHCDQAESKHLLALKNIEPKLFETLFKFGSHAHLKFLLLEIKSCMKSQQPIEPDSCLPFLNLTENGLDRPLLGPLTHLFKVATQMGDELLAFALQQAAKTALQKALDTCPESLKEKIKSDAQSFPLFHDKVKSFEETLDGKYIPLDESSSIQMRPF